MVTANFSLHFCDAKEFLTMWQNITNSIKINGYFVGNFFEKNDSWCGVKDDINSLDILGYGIAFNNKKAVLK